MVLFGAPFSSAYRGTLPKGEIVTITNDPTEGATAVGGLPKHYEELEQVFVPARDRSHSRYSNYELRLCFRTLAREFELVSESVQPSAGSNATLPRRSL